jgi:uncharacterized protein Yka (UPF0111/DUF47 family)
MGYKTKPVTKKIGEALEAANAELDTLKEEFESWRDGMEESFGQTDKFSTVSEAADAIEGIDVPDFSDLDDDTKLTEVSFSQQTSSHVSKAVRVSNLMAVYEAVAEALQKRMNDLRADTGDDESKKKQAEACEEVSDLCTNVQGELDNIELP